MGYHRIKNTAYGRRKGIFFNVIMVDTGNAALYGTVGSCMMNDGQPKMPWFGLFVELGSGFDPNR